MKTYFPSSSGSAGLRQASRFTAGARALAAMLFLGGGSLMAGSPGQLLREIWENIEGDQLPGHKDWPTFYGEPTHTVMLNGVETPVNRGNNYGQRLRGWITPTVTGEHTFWIAGDNFSQLWLSTTASKFDKERIAFIDGWTNVRQWDKFASQQSTPVHLVAGQKYYLEILQKEGTGGDHVSIAWQPPGGSQVVVPSSVLESFDGDPLDVDDDDLPDAWEIEMGLSVEPGMGKWGDGGHEGDPDGDGFSNMEEWFAGGDPLKYERIPGGLTREVWRDLAGATVGHLTNSPRFLQRPTFRGFMSGADAPVDDGENYGQRLRGYVTIPESGNYRFHIAGDDHVELWIAESGSHFDRRRAAWHTTWTNHLEWSKAGTQQTAVLPLAAGQKVYVEALQKEALGGDNLSIGWSFNGGSPGVIPEEHLEAFATHPDDVDEDYLSDSWELEHGFDVGDNGLLYPDQRWSADPDGDGFNNLLEYQSGGDPHVQGGNLGYFRRDIWTGLEGNEISDLTSSPGFPQSPNSSTYVSGKLELGTYGDRYGQKLTGVLMPPLSGQWRFSIASDDSSELWLSNTTSPAIKQKIAWLTGYTGVGNYDAFPSQKSEWTHLDSNNDYYFEVLHKEGIGADHVSVAWEYQAFNWALAANGSTATQSSTYGGLEADRAIDGNTDGNPAAETTTHTQNLANSWWQVDFGQDRPVNRVVLFNRTDANAIQNQERLSNFRISVLDAADNELVGQNFFTTSGYVQKSMAWDLPELVNARKIKVQILGYNLKGNGFLCLAEVQAFDWIGENARQVIAPQHLRLLGAQDVDSDGDGLPDWWEMEHFGSLEPGASEDYDSDGVNNLAEFLAGTNPATPQNQNNSTDGQANYMQVVAGGNHTLALRQDGTVWAWGRNTSGQLGDGTRTQRSSPVQLPGLSGVVSLAAGDHYSLAVKSDGAVWAWGDSGNGQLGDGTRGQRSSPVQLPELSGVVSLTAGSSHSLEVKSDGTVWAWGDNGSGQLGDGTTTQRTSPVKIPALSGVVSLAVGFSHSLAVKSDGKVWAWGRNTSGQLGDGTTTQWASPVEVPGLSGVVSLAAGSSHSLAVKSDGTVWAWGDNGSGQLGDGTTTQRTSPVLVPGLSGVVSLAAGGGHNLALKSDGKVWAWGHNASGQLGDGTTTQRNSPVLVPGLSGVVSLAVGSNHSLALKSDGTVWAWGYNSRGQLGDGTTTRRTSPVQLPSLSGVVSLAAGSSHSLAVKSDGTVWAWGDNGSGQLGDGTTTLRSSPVQIPGLSGVISLAAGGSGSLALKEDSTILTWGLGNKGQLANGFGSYYTEPRAVLGLNLLHPTPLIEITAPANEAVVPLGGSVTLQTNPTVSSGSIEKVVFYADGIFLGEDDTAPFTYTYTPESWGNLDINALAVSAAGAFSLPAHIRLQTPYDSDGDGMGDWWELEQFGSLAQGALDDHDNDGTSDLDEFRAGTNPNDQLDGYLDEDGDGLPDWWEQMIIDASGDPLMTIHVIHPGDDFDGDRISNETEWLIESDPTDAASTGPDGDGDGLPDAWENHHAGNLTDLSDTSNADGDWLDDLDEYRLGTSPLVNDDTDRDGWLDRYEVPVVLNSGGEIASIEALTPWGDHDGDGVANAAEVANGTDPLTAQEVSSYSPVVKLLAADFSDAGAQATWSNTGGLGGTFNSVTDKPLAATLGGRAAVQFQAAKSDAMGGPWTAPWLNATGSRTVVAWVYNPDVTTDQQDVVCSWGAGSLESPTPTLFSCRYGAQGAGAALGFSGSGSMDQSWGAVTPRQGQWSFVVYRYDQRTGALLAMRDLEAGVTDYGVFLQTGIFNTTGKPNRLVVGGDNDGNGGIQTGQVTALGLGELRIYGEALPLAAILSLYEETKGGYGISGGLEDADGDGVPDILEVSLGWNPAAADGDEDGTDDGAEFDNGTSGKDFYNSRSHAVQVVGGDAQIIDVGTETPLPLVYKVTDLDGLPLSNAPFKVDVTTLPAGGGEVRLAPTGSPLGSSVNTRTDANGEVKVYFKAN